MLRFTLAALSLACLALPVQAVEPDQLRVLEPGKDGAGTTILKKYLLDQMRPHFEARRSLIKGITTPEQFAERQKFVRETLERDDEVVLRPGSGHVEEPDPLVEGHLLVEGLEVLELLRGDGSAEPVADATAGGEHHLGR